MVKEVTPREWGELLEVWESAVRATHDFISEEDLQFYKKAIPERYCRNYAYIVYGMRPGACWAF